MRSLHSLLLVTVSTYVAGISLGGDSAPPNAALKAVTWNGNGCAQDTNTTWTLDGAGILNFVTPTLKVVAGGESKRADLRKFCQVNVDMLVPEGWQYGIQNLLIGGTATLVEGLGGSAKVTAYFSGQEAGEQAWTNDLVGKMNDKFAASLQPAEAIWSTCGSEAMLNIKVEASFDSTAESLSGLILVDSTSLEVRWQQCTKTG